MNPQIQKSRMGPMLIRELKAEALHVVRTKIPEDVWDKLSMDDPQPPDTYLCPITCMLMKEPTMAIATGNTYERSAITKWIKEHGNDPLDRDHTLTVAQLAPNVSRREDIEKYVADKWKGDGTLAAALAGEHKTIEWPEPLDKELGISEELWKKLSQMAASNKTMKKVFWATSTGEQSYVFYRG